MDSPAFDGVFGPCWASISIEIEVGEDQYHSVEMITALQTEIGHLPNDLKVALSATIFDTFVKVVSTDPLTRMCQNGNNNISTDNGAKSMPILLRER